MKRHNLRGHRLYFCWKNMLSRCTNTNHPAYSRYGGRGIVVCDRWLSIENFIFDMYPTFVDGLTLDRIDNDGNYHIKNCRWANRKDQSTNRCNLFTSNTSGVNGVSYVKSRGVWRAQKRVDDVLYNLGNHKTKELAKLAVIDFITKRNTITTS